MTADGAITFERKLEGVVVSAAPGANASANIVEVRPTSPGAKPANVVAGRPLNLSEVQPRRKFDGLVVIDGKIAEQSEFDRLSPSIIASVEVLKGESGKALYSDPRAANGVIRVTTKAKQ